jgi:glycine oxidase
LSGLGGLRVLVAGAGATGAAVAWRLQVSGARVVLTDPAGLGENASGVAAGMLAPAFEAALDPASAGHFGLYLAARDRWPTLAGELGCGEGLDRSGALWTGNEASLDRMQHALDGQGAQTRRQTADQAAGLSQGLLAPGGAVFTPDDWRLDPRDMLARLARAFLEAGGQRQSAALVGVDGGRARLANGESVGVDHVVLATGMPPRGLEDPPAELGVLQPIKGQLVRLAGAGPRNGPSVRAQGVYVVPGSDGAVVGATMEAGRADTGPDPAQLERLRAAAAGLYADVAGARFSGMAGVRASTPDALPMVGPSSRSGVMLALGARRNGWLLAPLIADIVAALLGGAEGGDWAARFDPLRDFSRPG